MSTEKGLKKLKKSYPVFVQAALICMFNMVSSSIYVYMNFFYTPLWLVQVAQFMWQCAQGMPPLIYLALNKTIRGYANNMVNGKNIQSSKVTPSAAGRSRPTSESSY